MEILLPAPRWIIDCYTMLLNWGQRDEQLSPCSDLYFMPNLSCSIVRRLREITQYYLSGCLTKLKSVRNSLHESSSNLKMFPVT